MRDPDSRKLKNAISGVMVVDKPTEMTSHDVIMVLRKGTGLRRIGHTGTLDPKASGVLVVLFGPAVRLSEYLLASKKRYDAGIMLGAVSDTYDSEGIITSTGVTMDITEKMIQDQIKGFLGKSEQYPPSYSAIKVKGQPAYKLARQGTPVELKPRPIEIFSFDLLEYTPPSISADIFCSSGTYIRSIANDLGNRLGCGAYLSSLRRTMCGDFTLRDAIPLAEIQKSFREGYWYQYLIPASELLRDFQTITLEADKEIDIRHGKRIPAENATSHFAKAVSAQGELLAILEQCEETHEWKPKKVLYP